MILHCKHPIISQLQLCKIIFVSIVSNVLLIHVINATMPFLHRDFSVFTHTVYYAATLGMMCKLMQNAPTFYTYRSN